MTDGSFISFGVEGVPYSQVRIELEGRPPLEGHIALQDDEAIVEAVRLAKVLADEYAATFYPERGAQPFTEDAPPWAREDVGPFEAPPVEMMEPPDYQYHEAPRPSTRPTQAAQQSIESGQRVRVSNERLACPECGQPVRETKPEWQVYEVGEDSREYPQKFMCPNQQCSKKSLWRSQVRPLAQAVPR